MKLNVERLMVKRTLKRMPGMNEVWKERSKRSATLSSSTWCTKPSHSLRCKKCEQKG